MMNCNQLTMIYNDTTVSTVTTTVSALPKGSILLTIYRLILVILLQFTSRVSALGSMVGEKFENSGCSQKCFYLVQLVGENFRIYCPGKSTLSERKIWESVILTPP